jgi:hypothetical protein
VGEEIASALLDGLGRFGVERALERTDFVACYVKCIEDLVCISDKISVIQVEPVMIVDVS